MRHKKHKNQLGVKTNHRYSILSNLSLNLFKYGRIQTTLKKAKALRPFAEKIISLGIKHYKTELLEKKLHYKRLAISKLNNKNIVNILFEKRILDVLDRKGGYTRIYKLIPRRGDAAKMAIIEIIKKN